MSSHTYIHTCSVRVHGPSELLVPDDQREDPVSASVRLSSQSEETDS